MSRRSSSNRRLVLRGSQIDGGGAPKGAERAHLFGTLELNPTDDSYINRDQPGTSQGSRPYLPVRNMYGTNENYGWSIRDDAYWGSASVPFTRFRSSDHERTTPYLEVEVD